MLHAVAPQGAASKAGILCDVLGGIAYTRYAELGTSSASLIVKTTETQDKDYGMVQHRDISDHQSRSCCRS